MKRMYKMHETSIILLLLMYIAIVGMINPSFVQFNSLSLMMKSSVILVVLAIGQSFVLFTKNIDVSVGSIMGLSALVCGMLLTNGYSAFFSIVATMILGTIIGFLNGIGVAKFRVPAIIMTLGMLGIIRGAMLIFTGGKWIEDIPNDFKQPVIYRHTWSTDNCMDCSYYFTTTLFLFNESAVRKILLCGR